MDDQGIFDIGDEVTVTASFTDKDGGAADPTITTFKVLSPLGVLTFPTVYQTGTGEYYASFVVTRRGIWGFHFQGTGAVQAAGESTVDVRKSRFS